MDRQELSDAVWERISPHLPGKVTDPGRSGRDNRLFVEAILWLARSVAHRLPALQPLVSSRRLGESFQGVEPRRRL
jgi:transposase